MISNLVMVSLSLYWLGGEPVVSRRIMDNSMCLILIRTSRKYILPTMTSFKWYLEEHVNAGCVHVRGLDVLGLVVLELDMQAVLDTDLHLDGVVAIWGHSERVYPDIFLLRDVRYTTRYCNSYEVSVLRVRNPRTVSERATRTVA